MMVKHFPTAFPKQLKKEMLDKKSKNRNFVFEQKTKGRSRVRVKTLSDCFSQSISFSKKRPTVGGGVECPKKAGQFKGWLISFKACRDSIYRVRF